MPYKRTGKPPGRPRRRGLRLAQRKAIKVELAYIHWGEWMALEQKEGEDWPYPWRASLRRVARTAGVSHETVREWRLSEWYWRGLLLRASLNSHKEKKETIPIPDRKGALDRLYAYLQKRWHDPIERDAIYGFFADRPDVIWIGDHDRVLNGKRRSREERQRRAKLQRWWMLQSRNPKFVTSPGTPALEYPSPMPALKVVQPPKARRPPLHQVIVDADGILYWFRDGYWQRIFAAKPAGKP